MSGVAEVVVVGGGAIGCAIARELARAGAAVLVVERDRPGAHASWAAAGMLSPQTEADESSAMLQLMLASRALFPALTEELRAETRIDVGYLTDGTLLLATRGDEVPELEDRYRWQTAAGLPVERLDPGTARELEPSLHPDLELALLFPNDHQVNSRDLTRALWLGAAAAGAEFRVGTTVEAVATSAERATGVRLGSGEVISAGAVVLAGGSWMGSMQGLPRPLPVRPVHGQLLALEAGIPVFRHVLASHHGYLVPRASGRIIAGATVEETGFLRAVTPAGVLQILQGALKMVPSLASVPFGDTWSGLRPGTPDALPILGPDPDLPNLFYATGHYRNGIALAPITAREIASRVLGGAGELDLEPFGIGRFEAGFGIQDSGFGEEHRPSPLDSQI